MTLYKEKADREGVAQALNKVSEVLVEQLALDDALNYAEQALTLRVLPKITSRFVEV